MLDGALTTDAYTKPHSEVLHSGKMLFWMLASLHLMFFCLPQEYLSRWSLRWKLNVTVSFVGTWVTTGAQVLENPRVIKKQTNQPTKQKAKNKWDLSEMDHVTIFPNKYDGPRNANHRRGKFQLLSQDILSWNILQVARSSCTQLF